MIKKLKKCEAVYVCDFEADKNGFCNMFYCENILKPCDNFNGENIKDFFDILFSKPHNIYIYFHNLSYDGLHIINYLLKNNIPYYNKISLKNNTFNSFIAENNTIYNIRIKHKGRNIYILDSKKVIDKSVGDMAKSLKIKKIAYNFEKEKNGKKLYIRCMNDAKIVAEYMRPIIKKYGIVSSASSIALESFIKNNITYKKSKYYITPTIEKSHYKTLRRAYIGGLCFLNDNYREKIINNVYVYDVNSMFPYIMANRLLPFGVPLYYKDMYKQDKIYNLYIQHIRADFTIKENKVPFVKDMRKYYNAFSVGALASSNGQIIDLYLTGDELQLFLENYNIDYIDYIDGYKFMSTDTLFKDYIKKVYSKKVKSKKKHNKVDESIYKILQNSLYGKFASKTEYCKKTPYIDNKGILQFRNDDKLEAKGLYIPIAIFITSYARVKLVRDIQKNIDAFIYCDTDSIHTNRPLDNLEIDDYKLGAYKLEIKNARAKYIKEKCYIIKDAHEFKKVIAGAGAYCKEQINFSNFRKGAIFENLKMKHTTQGVILDKDIFKIL